MAEAAGLVMLAPGAVQSSIGIYDRLLLSCTVERVTWRPYVETDRDALQCGRKQRWWGVRVSLVFMNANLPSRYHDHPVDTDPPRPGYPNLQHDPLFEEQVNRVVDRYRAEIEGVQYYTVLWHRLNEPMVAEVKRVIQEELFPAIDREEDVAYHRFLSAMVNDMQLQPPPMYTPLRAGRGPMLLTEANRFFAQTARPPRRDEDDDSDDDAAAAAALCTATDTTDDEDNDCCWNSRPAIDTHNTDTGADKHELVKPVGGFTLKQDDISSVPLSIPVPASSLIVNMMTSDQQLQLTDGSADSGSDSSRLTSEQRQQFAAEVLSGRSQQVKPAPRSWIGYDEQHLQPEPETRGELQQYAFNEVIATRVDSHATHLASCQESVASLQNKAQRMDELAAYMHELAAYMHRHRQALDRDLEIYRRWDGILGKAFKRITVTNTTVPIDCVSRVWGQLNFRVDDSFSVEVGYSCAAVEEEQVVYQRGVNRCDSARSLREAWIEAFHHIANDVLGRRMHRPRWQTVLSCGCADAYDRWAVQARIQLVAAELRNYPSQDSRLQWSLLKGEQLRLRRSTSVHLPVLWT